MAASPKALLYRERAADPPGPETLILTSRPSRPHPVSLREPDLSRKRERQTGCARRSV